VLDHRRREQDSRRQYKAQPKPAAKIRHHRSMIAMSAVCIAPGKHCACHADGGMFARLAWLLVRLFMGVSVIHVVLVFRYREFDVLGAFMEKLFRSDT
jgi:hypothetical protein